MRKGIVEKVGIVLNGAALFSLGYIVGNIGIYFGFLM